MATELVKCMGVTRDFGPVKALDGELALVGQPNSD